jgi:hypothetical protein
MKDLCCLVNALRELSPSIRESSDRAWSREPALRVIDCVLSLNRNYDRFVIPRLDSFERDRPSVRSISDLTLEIARYESPDEFVRCALNYKHKNRADILANVTRWLLTISGSGEPAAQLARLETWAKNAPYYGYRTLEIRGFALAGFQYLRMLFGANTTKPDIRICQWVAGAVGHVVSSSQALQLLESAAAEAEISLRDADTTIWEMLSRSQRAIVPPIVKPCGS